MDCGLSWSVGISTVLQRLLPVPLKSLNDIQVGVMGPRGEISPQPEYPRGEF